MTTIKIAQLDSSGNVPAALLSKQGKMSSGFPARRTGEQNVSFFLEQSYVQVPQASPVGSKPVILCEVWDRPSVLRHIWMAYGNSGETTSINAFPEQGGVIRIYNDDDTNPRVNLPLADFFAYGPLCGTFYNKRIARTASGGGQQTGAYRYLWSPSQKYLRVEVENVSSQIPEFTTTVPAGATYTTLTANGSVNLPITSLTGVGTVGQGGGGTIISAGSGLSYQFRFYNSTAGTPNVLTGVGLVNGSSSYTPAAGDTITLGNNVGGFYATASYSLPATFSDLGSSQLSYYIGSYSNKVAPVQTTTTLLNLNNVGPGQIESFMMRYYGASATYDSGILEGNIEFYPDGSNTPSLRSSGTEDFFNGAWYNIPVGVYPAGQAGSSGAGGFAISCYRFFEDDPQFFNTGIKIIEWLGQPGESSNPWLGSATIDFSGRVGYWLDAPGNISYVAPNLSATPLFTPPTITGPGSLPSWITAGSGTWSASSDGYLVSNGAGANSDLYASVNSYSAPTSSGYFVQASVSITNETTNAQEVGLGVGPTGTSGLAIGNRAWIEIKRNTTNQIWYVILRDGYDSLTNTIVGNGDDNTGVFFDLGLKVIGSQIEGYYRFTGDSNWHSIGKFNSRLSSAFSQIGIVGYNGSIKTSAPTVYPLHTVTS